MKTAKKLMGILLALTTVFAAVPLAASAEQTEVRYLCYNESTGDFETERCTVYTTVEQDTTVWETGFYVVDHDVTLSGAVTVATDADVGLILTDGCTLTVPSVSIGSLACLSIYEQGGDDAGSLVTSYIDGTETVQAELTVHGGNITAECRDGEMAIGAYFVTVHGGNITAKSMAQGLYVLGDLTVDGGSICVTDTPVGINSFESARIMNASVSVTGALRGMYTTGDLVIKNSRVLAEGSASGIYSNSGIVISDGNMTVRGGTSGTPAIEAAGTISLGSGTTVVDANGEAVEDPDWSAGYYRIGAFPTYLYSDGTDGLKQAVCSDCTVIDGDNTPNEWQDGVWYYAKGIASIDEKVTVSGEVHLIVEDRAELTVSYGICEKTPGTGKLYVHSRSTDAAGTLICEAGNDSTGDDAVSVTELSVDGAVLVAIGDEGRYGGTSAPGGKAGNGITADILTANYAVIKARGGMGGRTGGIMWGQEGGEGGCGIAVTTLNVNHTRVETAGASGGAGGNAEGVGGNGGKAGKAILAESVTVNDSVIISRGGSGGSGGKDYPSGGEIGDTGDDHGNPGDGADGGSAISAASLTVTNGSAVTATAGNGGNGGKGGKGGDGVSVKTLTVYDSTVTADGGSCGISEYLSNVNGCGIALTDGDALIGMPTVRNDGESSYYPLPDGHDVNEYRYARITSALLTVSANDDSRGSVSVSPRYPAAGAAVSLTASAKEGYRFSGFISEDEVRIFTEGTDGIFIMPDGKTAITAVFEPLSDDGHTITVSPNYSGMGSIEAPESAKFGEKVTLVPSANAGNAFITFISPDVAVGSDGSFIMPDKPVYIRAIFEADAAFEDNTSTPVQAQKNADSKTAILRFMWSLAKTNGAHIANIGAYIIPWELFDEGTAARPAIVLLQDPVVKDGDTFAADYIGIPESKYDTDYCAIPFINGTFFAEAMLCGNVNDADIDKPAAE